MSDNSFGRIFRVTTWGESHGPALGATIDGCPPGVPIDEAMIQQWLDKRKPGQNKLGQAPHSPDCPNRVTHPTIGSQHVWSSLAGRLTCELTSIAWR